MEHLLIIGVAAVAIALIALLCLRARTEARRAEEQMQKLHQDRQRLLEFMHLMTEALGEGLSIEALRQRIVHAAIVCTGASSGCFFEKTKRETMHSVAVEGLFPPHRPLPDEAKAGMTTRAKFIEQVLKAEEFPISEGIVGRVARTRRAELLEDAETDDRIVKHDDPALAVRSVIVVPLVFRERFFGVLAVTNPAGRRRFNEDDFRLMESLAEQAALALHNAAFLHLQMEKQQMDLDLSIASSIQQMLLPRGIARFDKLEVDARNMPAQKIGGDLYDLISLSPSRLGVVVADVSGKGVAASLLMAICRTNLRQIAHRHVSPAAVLRELNRTIESEIQAGLYVTMIYAIFDTAEDKLTFARAGHELPMIVRRDGATGTPSPEFVESEGMAVGMVPDEMFAASIADRTELFLAGDVFVLYTDGLTESPNEEGREYSGARLADTVRGAYGQPPREVNNRILESLARFTGATPQRDDYTLVTVRRL